MLDPILERQSKIAKVIDEPFTCYKKSKKAVKQTKIEFFSLKFQSWYMKMGKKGDFDHSKVINIYYKVFIFNM